LDELFAEAKDYRSDIVQPGVTYFSERIVGLWGYRRSTQLNEPSSQTYVSCETKEVSHAKQMVVIHGSEVTRSPGDLGGHLVT